MRRLAHIIDTPQYFLDFSDKCAPPSIGDGSDTQKNFSLLDWWMRRNGWQLAVAALILGCEVRSLRRWYKLKRVPRSVAMHIDQSIRGPIVTPSLESEYGPTNARPLRTALQGVSLRFLGLRPNPKRLLLPAAKGEHSAAKLGIRRRSNNCPKHGQVVNANAG